MAGPSLGQGSLTRSRHKVLRSAALPTSEAAQLTAAAGHSLEIKTATVTNTSGGSLTFTLSIVPKGGSAGAANRVVSARSLAAGASASVPELVGACLADEDFVSGVGSGSGLAMVLTGIVYGGS